MVKKLIAVCLIVVLTGWFLPVRGDELMDITRAAGYDVSDANRPASSIVIDAQTGAILWGDNIDEVRDPASMSKVMTLYLTYEAISQGKFTEDTLITASVTDQQIAGIYAISNNKIVAGVDYTVGELITMTAVPSSNAATIMLANYLSDNDPDAFIDLMNTRAQELGMTNTYWNNASGAVAVAFEGYYSPTRYDRSKTNRTTARDLAILTYHFLKKYPAILEHTNKTDVTVKAGTPYEESFHAYNHSLPDGVYGIEGVDGLKTGSSPSAAFNCIMTAKRGDQRLIEVIMGVGDWSDQNGEFYRHPFANALLEKAYAEYDYRKLLDAGKQTINGKTYQLEEAFYGTVPKAGEATYLVEQNQLTVDNHLESVSPLISDSVPVTEEQGFFQLPSGQTDSPSEQVGVGGFFAGLLSNWYWLLLLPLLFVVVLILLKEKRKHRRLKEKRAEAGYERSRRNRRR